MRRTKIRTNGGPTIPENTPAKPWNVNRIIPRCNAASACISIAILLAVLSLLTELAEIMTRNEHPEGDIWKTEGADKYVSCSNWSNDSHGSVPDYSSGFILIRLSGGLNQQRIGIVNAVIVARILNASLVVPYMDRNSFWKDESNFEDIFDLPFFIKSLEKDVKIIKKLPELYKTRKVFRKLVPRHSNVSFYQTQLLPRLQKAKVVELTKFDYRLSDSLPADLQKLRCRVNYHALRFTRPIRELGETAVKALRLLSPNYVAVHLRYESDMLAFSGCNYGGGEEEIKQFEELRKRWPKLPKLDPLEERRKGKCPLSPAEVGVLLQGLGFEPPLTIYIASGDIHGGEASLAPLKSIYGHVHRKDTLLPPEDLLKLQNKSAAMAAIDYHVALESTVFLANNNGNMAKVLEGHRRYLGHRKTILPNGAKTAELMMSKESVSDSFFKERVQIVQRGFMGEPHFGIRKHEDFFENPQACLCDKKEKS